MEEFRELVLLLKSYAADDHIEVYDSTSIKQLPFWNKGWSKNGYPDWDISYHGQQVYNGHNQTDTLPLQVRQRLWNTLLFLDSTQEDTHEPARVAYLCWQRLAVLKTLMGVGAIKSLREMAESLLQSAKTYELTVIVIETAAQLRQFSALHDGNMLAFEKYCQLINQYEKILQAEQLADDEYCAFLFQQNQEESTTQSLILQAQSSCQKLEAYTTICSSVSFLTNLYFLKLQAAFLGAQWEVVVQIGIQAEAVLRRKSVCSPAKISAFALSKALGQANLGQLEQALESLASAIVTEKEGSDNWYRLQELKLIWLLHRGSYNQALDLLKILNLKNRYPVWPMEQKRLYNSMILALAELELLNISNRLKGVLMANCLPFWNLAYVPEVTMNNLDAQAALLLVQLPKWIQRGASEQLADWFQSYLVLSEACTPHAQRLEALILSLRQIHAGQNYQESLLHCLQKLAHLPLDYSSPEAAPEVLKLDTILTICLA